MVTLILTTLCRGQWDDGNQKNGQHCHSCDRSGFSELWGVEDKASARNCDPTRRHFTPKRVWGSVIEAHLANEKDATLAEQVSVEGSVGKSRVFRGLPG